MDAPELSGAFIQQRFFDNLHTIEMYGATLFGEKVAFQGVDKHSIVSVGTYGQIQTAESKRYFREGLIAMLDELEPQVVLVYGSMPNQIFGGLSDRTKFMQFPDWTTRMKTIK